VELSFDELRVGERGLMPAFVWTFDDGYDELHQDVLPYLTPLGQRATVYLTASFVGGSTTLSLPHLRDLYAAGWALGNHSTQHVDLSSVDQATAAAQIRGCTDWLIANGFPRAAYHMAYPFNNSSASARAAATECGILTARRHGFRNQHVPIDEALMLNSFGVEDATPTIEAWRTKIDRAIDSGSTLVFYGHYFTSDNLPLFKQIADYVAQRRLWTPPIDEWWDTLALQAEAGESFAGSYLYVACGDAGVQVVDISDPTAPVLMGGYAGGGGGATDVAPYDDGACVAAGSAGLQVVEALQPATPALAGGLAGGSAPSKGICVRGTRTYVAAGADGLRIVSTADPANPVQLGALDTPGDACDVTVVGTLAYVADGPEGIQVIDVSDPARPALVGTHALTAPAEALVVFGGTAYVPDGLGGLQVVPL
jgi:peptidoglycan/xylan/chitin deacetylase (PgdA/CDA1 family)